MTLKDAAQTYLALLDAHDGTMAHGYKLNAARAELQRLYWEQTEKHLGNAQAAKVAREIVEDYDE